MNVKLKMYQVNIDYVKFLYEIDKKVQYNPNEPDSYTENRPYIGIVLEIYNMKYFAPLEHHRDRHNKLNENLLLKIKDYGIIGFNNMIPVPQNCLKLYDIENSRKKYIILAELREIKNMTDRIIQKTDYVYRNRTLENPSEYFVNNCCDFKKLEEGYYEYIHNFKLNKEGNQETVNANIAAPCIQPEKEKPKKDRTFYLDDEWER